MWSHLKSFWGHPKRLRRGRKCRKNNYAINLQIVKDVETSHTHKGSHSRIWTLYERNEDLGWIGSYMRSPMVLLTYAPVIQLYRRANRSYFCKPYTRFTLASHKMKTQVSTMLISEFTIVFNWSVQISLLCILLSRKGKLIDGLVTLLQYQILKGSSSLVGKVVDISITSMVTLFYQFDESHLNDHNQNS